jgi:hypothetical protein
VSDPSARVNPATKTPGMFSIAGKLGKKESELQQNIKKLERVLYELSLLKATGRKVQTESADEPSGEGAED